MDPVLKILLNLIHNTYKSNCYTYIVHMSKVYELAFIGTNSIVVCRVYVYVAHLIACVGIGNKNSEIKF